MFGVKLDRSRNTLTIPYGSRVTLDETRLCREEVRLASTILQPGFRLIANPTELQTMEEACSPPVAAQILAQSGCWVKIAEQPGWRNWQTRQT
jgi:hypothetical protein